MTRFYIANPTNQGHDFEVRLPERKTPVRTRIEAGTQLALGGDLNLFDIDAILEQHTPFGLREASDKIPNGVYVPLIYSKDRPVKVDRIQEVGRHNEFVLIVRGQESRKAAAIAVNERIENTLFERRLGEQLNTLEMSVMEENRDPRDQSPEVAEGVRVTREMEVGSSRLAQRQGRGRRAGRKSAPAPELPPANRIDAAQ